MNGHNQHDGGKCTQRPESRSHLRDSGDSKMSIKLQPTSLEDKLSSAHAAIEHLQYKNQQLNVSKCGLDSISQYDETVKFYTGFTNYMLLQGFFQVIQPTATSMTQWTQYQSQHHGKSTSVHVSHFHCEHLSLLDQLFEFLHKIRLGNNDQELADKSNVLVSTISDLNNNHVLCILFVMVNFLLCDTCLLCTVCGSLDRWSGCIQCGQSIVCLCLYHGHTCGCPSCWMPE